MLLAEGARNTRFFHLRASHRKWRNKITKLKRASGEFTKDKKELRELATNLYGKLLHSEGVHNMEPVLSTVLARVSSKMNDKLLQPFSRTEVKEALF
jgi:hypothetical protein